MEGKKYPTPRGTAASKAKAKYNAKAYDQFLITVPKGYKDKITTAAADLQKPQRIPLIREQIGE